MSESRILLVEDQEKIRVVMARYLEGRGHEVLVADEAEYAVSVFEGWRPALVLIDYSLPDATGAELAARIRAVDANVPLILMGSADELAVVESARPDLALAGTLVKPFSGGQLVDAVAGALRRTTEPPRPADDAVGLTAELARVAPAPGAGTGGTAEGETPAPDGPTGGRPLTGEVSPAGEGTSAPPPAADGDAQRGQFRRRADTQVLLKTAPLYPDDADPAETGPADSIPGLTALEELHTGVPVEEDRYALAPMTPTAPTDPQGIYGEVTLPQLLYNVFRDIFSGRLRLQRGRITKEIFILNGYPIFAESNVRSENLGHQLLLDGVISEADHRRSIELVRAEGIRQGEALIRLGVIDREQLQACLRRQVRERLLNCFGWTGASYGLVYDQSIGGQVERFEVNPLVLVFEGIKTSFPIAPLVAHFDAYPARIARTTAKLGDYATMLREFADELRVAHLCDGRRTVGQVLAASPYGLIDTLRILRALEITACIQFDEAPSEGVERPATGPLRGEGAASRRNTGPIGEGGAPRRSRPSGSLRPTTTPPRQSSMPSRGATGTGAYRVASSAPPAASAPPPAAEPPPLSPEDAALAREIEERLAAAGGTCYECLGVPTDATPAQIRAAYDRLRRLCHPDRLAAVGDETVLARGRALRERLEAAYETLNDPRRRREYDALHLEVPTEIGDKPDIIQAEINFNKGLACLNQGETGKASEFFDVACRQDPHQALYRMYRAWARFLRCDPNDRKGRTEAHEALKAALADDSTHDEGFVLLAHTYRDSGNLEMAAQFYRKALGINRRNADARRELERLEARAGGDKKGKEGLFGKLFTRR